MIIILQDCQLEYMKEYFISNNTMSKNKFGSYKIGQDVLFNNEKVIILDKIKGNKTKRPNKQGGIVTGYKSSPCLYKLSNGLIVKGSTIEKKPLT